MSPWARGSGSRPLQVLLASARVGLGEHEKAIALTGEPEPLQFKDRIVGIIRYRDGSVIDVVRQVEN